MKRYSKREEKDRKFREFVENAQSTDSQKKLLPLKDRFTRGDIYELIEKTHGNSQAIITALECSRAEWNAYLKKAPECVEEMRLAREAVVDKAEEVMSDLLQEGNPQVRYKSAEFLLKTLGKNRGYSGYDCSNTQQVSIEGEDGKRIDIKTIFGLT